MCTLGEITMNKDKKFCEGMLLEIKSLIASPNTDRFWAVCRLHDARVKLFKQMNECLTNTKGIPKMYHMMLNYIDCLDVIMDEDRDITKDLIQMTQDMEKALGVKKN